MTTRHRHAFTLVEMLVVITIITMLFGAAAVGVNLVLKSKAKTETSALIRNLTQAIKAYAEDGYLLPSGSATNATSGLFKNTSTNPNLYLYLSANPPTVGKPAYIEIPKWALNGSVITDAWGDDLLTSGTTNQTITGTGATSNSFDWAEGGSGSKCYLKRAIIRSKAGTEDTKNKKDDIIFFYDYDSTGGSSGEWQQAKVE